MLQKLPVPKGVLLVDQVSGQPADPPCTAIFKAYAINHWLSDKRWITVWVSNLDALLRLKKEFSKAEEEIMEFEEGDLKLLVEIIGNPSAPREDPLVFIQLQPTFEQPILNLVKKSGAEPNRKAK